MYTVLLDLTIIATETRVRGIGRYAAELAIELGRLQLDDLRVLFLEEIGWDGRVLVSDDPELALERLLDPKRPETGRWSWAYRSRLGTAMASRYARADLLHLPHSSATPLMDGRARRLVTCHDLIPLHFPEHYLDWRDGWAAGRRLLDRRRFFSADHILAISDATAADLRELLNVPAKRITVVRHGIDHQRWRPDADAGDEGRLRELGLDSTPFLLYVGDGDWRKNATGMFRALAAVRRRHGAMSLLWAGRLNPSRLEKLRAEASRHGVAEAVTFLGHVEDDKLFALYRHALATLLVSRAEGFGLPVLEAMAIGCPVVTSDCSSMAEIAGDGAALVDPEDGRAIADAIIALAADPEARAAQRRRGLRRASEFTRERQALETVELYRRLLAQ